MTFQAKTETLTGLDIALEIDADTGLNDEARQAIAGVVAAGGIVEKNTHWREASPISIEKGAGFCLAFLDNFLSLLDSGLSPQEMKVAAYTLRQMEYGNLVCLSQTSIAIDLGLHRQAVNRHFRSLEAKGFFVKKDGHLFVNSAIFAKGLATRMDADRIANLASAHDTRAGKYKPTLKPRAKR